MFKFRKDNRNCLNNIHINKLINSIQARNMLQFRPILVNEDMEILDGQHRLMAAKSLGVEIYYEVQKNFDPKDIIKLNIAEKWSPLDYLNFYVRHGYPEYIKLKNFIDSNNLTLRIALALTVGRNHSVKEKFKNGDLEFNVNLISKELELCREFIEYIKKTQGVKQWTSTSKFWQAMIVVFQDEDFKEDVWRRNYKKFIERVDIRASINDYVKMLSEIHNHRNNSKITTED